MANSKTNENKTKRKTTKKTAPGSNVTRKSTAKGSTTTRKKGTTQKNSAQRNYTQRDEGIPMSNEITLVVSFGLVVLMMFSNFGHCGMIGKWLASFFFGIFGCAQFVMPVFFFLGVTILIANDYSTLAMKKCGAGFIILMEVSALSQLLYKGASITVHDLFSLAINNHVTGGIIGGGIALLLKGGFGTAGAMVILFCIFLLSCILLTQRSFVSFFKKIVKDMKTSREEWKKAAQQKQLEREAAATEDILINLDEEETPDRTKSFLKMKNGKKKTTEKRRTEQCEEKVKELEERRLQKESAREKIDKTEPKKNLQDLKVNVPLFTSSDEVKRKDCVKELHPRIYPFTEEDGKTEPFQGKLDFSAFTFPDEIKESASSFEEETNQKEKEETVYEAPHKAKGGFHTSLPEEIKISGLKTSVKEPVENIVSEADAILEEDISVNLPDFSQSMMEAERINDEEKDKEKDKETTEYKLIDSETANVEAMTNEVVEINNEAADNEENASEISNISDNEVIESEAKDNEIISNETVVKEIKAKEAAVPDRKKAKGKDYIFPPVTLLIKEQQTQSSGYEQYLKETALKLQQTLESFGVNVTITDISCGPSVTRYEMFPEQGTKVSKILSLTDDIKLNLAVSDVRIEAPIPGKAAIGIEIPNKHNQTVHFRDLIESSTFKNFKSRLAFAVGKDIGGKTVVTDLAKMPHLLIAGATGSGKSVCINTLIMSILYKASPEEVKLIMVDPKMVELSIYNGIPHLLIPVVTDPKKASGALNWAVAEMTNRYKKFTETGVRNIEGYNKKVKELQKSGEIDPETIKKMPQIVIIIDELADLMMVAPGEVEDAIVRLSQLARAAGIHLVIATQRPSVNVITGLIKANVPSRIAFSVSSGVDSRTIIDMNGAEKLLGKGDMLFDPLGAPKAQRIQGCFVSDTEVESVVEALKQNNPSEYNKEILKQIEQAALAQQQKGKKDGTSLSSSGSGMTAESEAADDEMFDRAVEVVIESGQASTSMLQRRVGLGYARAARLIDYMEQRGIVGPYQGSKPRKVLMTKEEWLEAKMRAENPDTAMSNGGVPEDF